MLLTREQELEHGVALGPQPGPQEAFLSTSADIAIYGGAAGGGKTYGLLLEPLRHIDNPGFGAVIFRRESVQITNEGGLYDTSLTIYDSVEGRPKLSPSRMWTFPSSATVTFGHLHNESDVLDWQGAQIPFIGYDELTHFTSNQFWYMLSRNRSTCGVKPYIRATCNPDVDSWVAELIEWWVDQDTGYPIMDRSGIIRYFIRYHDKLIWGETPEQLMLDYKGSQPKSFTFIPSTLDDNKILLESDPGYRANLLALGNVEQERLLRGNWKIRPQAGSYFPSTKVGIIPAVPTDVSIWIRRWDLAATEPSEANPSPDSSASVLMGKRANGKIVVADAINVKIDAGRVRETVLNVASQDRSIYRRVYTVIPQDPGQAGKEQVQSYATLLHGHRMETVRETGPKVTRAEPFSAQWQAGNVELVEGSWNRNYMREMEAFPSTDAHDDYVDASSGAYLACVSSDHLVARRRALGS